MHLRSPAGPISVYVLNRPEAETPSSNSATSENVQTVETAGVATSASTPSVEAFQSREMVVGGATQEDKGKGRSEGDTPMEIDSEDPIPKLKSHTRSRSDMESEVAVDRTATDSSSDLQSEATVTSSE